MKFIINFLKLLSSKDRLYFYFLIAAAIINVFLELLSIGMVIPLIGLILNPNIVVDKISNYFPNFEFLNIISDVNYTSYIFYFLVIFFLLFLFKNIFIFIYFYLQNKFVQKVEQDLSRRILKKYLLQEYSFFVENNSSSLTSKLSADLLNFTRGFVGPLITLISEIMIVIGFCSIIIIFDLVKVGLIFLFFFTITAAFLKVIGNLSKKWGKQRKYFDSVKLDILKTTFLNIKSIILDNKYEKKIDDFFLTTKKLANLQRKIITTNVIPKISFELIGILSIVIVLYYLITNNFSKEYIITTTGFFIAVAYRIIPSFQRIIFSYQTISFSKVVLKSISDDLKLNDISDYSKEKIGFKENIKLNNLSFSHKNRSRLILDNINLEIKAGEIVGIFGESGAGKSTLVDIISGLLKPSKGELLIDKEIINSENLLRKWQNEIAYVTQNTALFKGSLKNNIIFSDITDKYDQNLFKKVIKQSQIHKFLNDLSEGYETDIGELGIKLSGGQKQRIGIARALYKNPKFLIFDEATNALDTISEKQIIDTIFEIKSNFTTIIISHKKNLIQRCDKIYQIEDGKVNLVSKP